MPKIALSQQLVKSTTCPIGKAKWDLFDSNCKGLMLETRATGGKTFYLRYQDARGKTRQLKLADERDISYVQAKQLADKHRNSIAMGLDPSEEKQSLKLAPTVAQFIHQSYMPFVQGYKRSWKCDLSLLKNHVEPESMAKQWTPHVVSYGECYAAVTAAMDVRLSEALGTGQG